MKDFIITMMFLIFAVGETEGKGNFSSHEDDELFEGTMHYFHCYELFWHKN